MLYGLSCETKEEFCQELIYLRDYCKCHHIDIWKIYDVILDLVNENYFNFKKRIQDNILTIKQLEDCLKLCDCFNLYEGTIIIIKRLNELNVPPAQHRLELGDIE